MKWTTKELRNWEDDVETKMRSVSLETLRSLLEYLDQHYYTGESLVSDATYDTIHSYYESQTQKPRANIGGIPTGTQRMTLPIHVGSMTKYKEEPAIQKYMSQYPGSKVLSEKLDGVSLVVEYTSKGPCCAFSKGKGSIGSNVSYLLPHLRLPERLESSSSGRIFIRGELIVSKSDFETIRATTHYKVARNYVAGIYHWTEATPELLKPLQFIAYELYLSDQETQLPLSQQLKQLTKWGFHVVRHEVWSPRSNKMIYSDLGAKLSDYKTTSEFEIDGLIVHDDRPYVRNTDGDPAYAFAFKMESLNQGGETRVVKILWDVSKDGKWKPVVEVEPIILGDSVRISRVTGYNANYVVENKIGPNAIVRIIRSGDVIPKIVEVIHPSPPNFPEEPYVWDDNHTDIVATDTTTESSSAIGQRVKQMEYFATHVGIRDCKTATLHKLYLCGVQSCLDLAMLPVFISIDPSRWEESKKTIGEKMLTKIAGSIRETMTAVSLPRLAMASGYFSGLGETRLSALLEAVPWIAQRIAFESRPWSAVDLDRLDQTRGTVAGFGDKLFESIYQGVPLFHQFVWTLKSHYVFTWATSKPSPSPHVASKKSQHGSLLDGKKYVCTGFRDETLETDIRERGGTIQSAVSSQTTMVIIKDNTSTSKGSKKVRDAEERGIPVIAKDDFREKYLS